jgi:hypothetical protein
VPWWVRVPVAAILAAATTAAAYEIAQKTVSEMTMSASDVAVIEVLRRVPVKFDFEGQEHTCGYRLEARVIESLTGRQKSIEFGDAIEGEPGELRARYLVFALEQPNEVDGRQPPTSLEEARAQCWISLSRWLVLVRPRGLLRIEGMRGPDGGRVMIPAESAIDVSDLPHDAAATRDAGAVVPWSAVREEILRTLDAMERRDGVDP